MANNKKQIISNNFLYGEMGNRLDGFRTSEIYQGGAKEIRNFIITDVGTIKVAKTFVSSNIEITGDVLRVAETSENTYLILTSTNIYQLSKNDNSILNTESHTMGNNADMSLIGKEILAVFDKSGNNKSIFLRIDNFTKETIELKYPIKDKQVLELSLWRVSQDPIDTSKLRLTQMSNFTNPKLKIKSNKIYLTQSDILINRIYVNYNVSPQADYFTEAKDGEIYGILRTTPQVKDGKTYIIDNTEVAFGTLTEDTKYKGKYFTEITGGDCDGIFSFGKLVNVEKPTNIGFYQDRTVFYVDNYLYFSKLREYFDFRNDINNDSPFFIQLNPINNTIGSLVGMISSNGLYILTTAGIYVIGYGTYVLTPQSISASVIPATDMGVSNSYEILDNILYFINYNGILKSLSMDRTSQQLSFIVNTVDKYSSKALFKDISKVSIEDKDYLLARGKDNKILYLIEAVGDGIFRKVSLDFDFDNEVFGLTDRFIMGNKVFKVSNQNYSKAILKLNPPALKQNSILVDNSSRIEMFAIKLINEDKQAIKGIILNNTNIQNLASDLDEYSIYRKRCNDAIKTGYEVEILSNENDKLIELQTVQLLCNVVEDI